MTGTIFVAVISSSALAALINGIFSERQRKRDDKEWMRTAIRHSYYLRIKHDGKRHIDAGRITAEELEDIIEDHRIYHDELKGNGYLDCIMSEVKSLKIVE